MRDYPELTPALVWTSVHVCKLQLNDIFCCSRLMASSNGHFVLLVSRSLVCRTMLMSLPGSNLILDDASIALLITMHPDISCTSYNASILHGTAYCPSIDISKSVHFTI